MTTVKASPSEQKKLLSLNEFDATLASLAHRERALPELAEIAAVGAERDAVVSRLASRVGELEDAQVELSRLESDAATVAARMKRDADRLQASSSAKDIAALEAEIESLTRRTAALEDQELVVMQRVEDAQAAVDAVRAEDGVLAERLAALAEAKEAALDAIAAERGTVTASRDILVSAVDPELLALYEAQRARTGVGAALFRAGTCGGCTMAMTGQDLADIRSAAADEVVRCPECGCIAVRTEESGLW